MAKKSCVSKLMDSQYVKVGKKMLTSPRKYFCHIFLSLWNETSSKKNFLVVSEVVRLFFNMLTRDDKYYLSFKASV